MVRSLGYFTGMAALHTLILICLEERLLAWREEALDAIIASEVHTLS